VTGAIEQETQLQLFCTRVVLFSYCFPVAVTEVAELCFFYGVASIGGDEGEIICRRHFTGSQRPEQRSQ
jgi:hypothetical protein